MQKYVFQNYNIWETGSWFSYVFETDDPKLPRKRKVSSHYEDEKAPVDFLSKFEEYYLHFFVKQLK